MQYETHLTDREQLGFNFEVSTLECLKGLGYSKYVTYHNPTLAFQWLRKKGFGVDLVLTLGKDVYYIEEKFMTYDYKVSPSSYENDTLARFKGLPRGANYHHLVLTNRPQNYSSVTRAVFFSTINLNLDLLVVNLDYIICLVRDYLVSITDSNLTELAILYVNMLSEEKTRIIESEFNSVEYEKLILCG